MSNVSTYYRADLLPSNDLGNVTSETQFANGRGSLLQLRLPSNNKLANRAFRVRFSGRVSTTSNVNFTLALYFGISSTIGSNTQVFSSGAQTVNIATSSFEVWVDMSWTADGKLITGWAAGQVANNICGPSTLSSTPISADPNRDSSTTLASGTTYGFTLTGLFSGSSAGNHAFVDGFEIEGV